MYKITFLRHGESEGNANGQIQGQTDTSLTERGKEQANLLATKWAEEGRQYDQVIASPLLRARNTAEIIAAALNLQVDFAPEWMERGFGAIEGRNFDELLQEIPGLDFNHPYLAPDGAGESIVDAYHRASGALQNLLRQPEGAYLVVSHGALLNMTMYAVLGISPHNSPVSPRFIFQNTGFVDLLFNPVIRQWRIIRFYGSETIF